MPDAEPTLQEQMKLIMDTGPRIHRYLVLSQERQVRDTACLELSVLQIQAIHFIHEAGGLTMTELAEFLHASPPAASSLVDRLVKKKLLVREHSKEDRRKVIVRVDPKALPGIDHFHEVLAHAFSELVGKLRPATMRKWYEVMTEVRAIMDEAEGTQR